MKTIFNFIHKWGTANITIKILPAKHREMLRRIKEPFKLVNSEHRPYEKGNFNSHAPFPTNEMLRIWIFEIVMIKIVPIPPDEN